MSEEIVLCSEKTEWVSVCVTASLDGAKLTISGVDCGRATEEFWSDSDYEYWYSFDEQNTALLFQKLGADGGDRLGALKERFSGMDGCRKLREYCSSAGIEYRFFSWV